MKRILLFISILIITNLVSTSKHHKKHKVQTTNRHKYKKNQNIFSDHQQQDDSVHGQNKLKKLKFKNLNIISVIGGPGTGKGTHCAFLEQNFGFKHISTGDLIRRQISLKGQLADEISTYISEGKLIPSETTVKLIQNQLEDSENQDIILLDGFPRNKQNIEKWQQILGSDLNIHTYLYLKCPINIMQKRLLERSKISGRKDDNSETIRKRLLTFQQETWGILQQINQNQDNTVIQIDTNRQIEQVSNQLRDKFRHLGYDQIKIQQQQML